MIAGALACQPAIMILDEPTTALDTTTEMQVLQLVKELRKKRNMALVYITHDLTLTDYICEEVLVMLNGSVVEKGLVKHIFKTPQTDYAKMLISSIPRVDAESKSDAFQSSSLGRDPLLSVKNLKFRYGQRGSLLTILKPKKEPLVVNNVSFDLERSETIGLVGESGSGKSTIANIVCGLLSATSGDVNFDRQPIKIPGKNDHWI